MNRAQRRALARQHFRKGLRSRAAAELKGLEARQEAEREAQARAQRLRGMGFEVVSDPEIIRAAKPRGPGVPGIAAAAAERR